MSMYIGEALVGDGNEISHIDLLIGSKDGPVGTAFANALANQSAGHTNLLAVITPNLLCKPATVLVTKVTHAIAARMNGEAYEWGRPSPVPVSADDFEGGCPVPASSAATARAAGIVGF